MSVSEITQRLLVQSEKVSYRSGLAGPRFQDLRQIYQIQNLALARLRKLSRSNDADPETSVHALLSMSSQSSQETLDSTQNYLEISEPKEREIDDDAPIKIPPFQILKAMAIWSSDSPLLLSSAHTPIRSSNESNEIKLPLINAESSSCQSERIYTSSEETSIWTSELRKRPRSSVDETTSGLISLLLLTASNLDGSRRTRIA
jgi:hypothetical protein